LRTAVRILGALLLLALLAAVWVVFRTFPKMSGPVRVGGHAAPVRIETDPKGVPTIRASSIPDALFGLGYVHARDRLWQLEFERRLGAGRLAEILGEPLVPADRFLRTIGFRRAAEATESRLSPSARRLLEAYAAGVNAFLAADSARPIEFRLLRVAPEPWTPADSLVWGKMMAWDLAGNARAEIRRARFLEAVGPERTAQLLPLAGSSPTILSAAEWPGSRGAPPASDATSLSLNRADWPGASTGADWRRLENAFAPVVALGLGAGGALGSNSWVLAGSRTASGKPILANDPHLGLKTPSVWYLVAIDAPGFRATGASLPGVPGILIGHNDRIAWGLTSLEPDVQDLFVEDVDPNDASRYRHRGEWKKFEERRETIRVRGRPDATLVVRSSVHGPVVNDALAGAGALGPAVALRWAGLDPDPGSTEAFLAIATARNWPEFLAGVEGIRASSLNVVYADVEGHIGYAAGGAMPIRPRADGLTPVPGTGEDDWTGFHDPSSLPRILDPASGYLVTANNRVIPADPYPFGRIWIEPFRAARIMERIEASDRLTPEAVAAIQLDQVSLLARELNILLATTPASDETRAALGRLAKWSGEMAPDSIEASIYAAWFVELGRMAQDELGDVPRGNVRGRFLVDALRMNSDWCDDVRTPAVETCAAFQAASLARALDVLRGRLGKDPEQWRWERLHRAVFPHDVFHEVPFLRRFFDLEIGQGGDGFSVNVGGFAQDGSFQMSDGPGYRQIVDLSEPVGGRYVITTGQSGNVFSRRYRNLLPAWRAGRYFEIENQPAADVLVLEPGGAR
jgi:penicillin amidase